MHFEQSICIFCAIPFNLFCWKYPLSFPLSKKIFASQMIKEILLNFQKQFHFDSLIKRNRAFVYSQWFILYNTEKFSFIRFLLCGLCWFINFQWTKILLLHYRELQNFQWEFLNMSITLGNEILFESANNSVKWKFKI